MALPGQGVTTHPSVVEATIDHLKELGAADIAIGESCIFGVNAQEAFQVTGMKEISEKKEVKLIDLGLFRSSGDSYSWRKGHKEDKSSFYFKTI